MALRGIRIAEARFRLPPGPPTENLSVWCGDKLPRCSPVSLPAGRQGLPPGTLTVKFELLVLRHYLTLKTTLLSGF